MDACSPTEFKHALDVNPTKCEDIAMALCISIEGSILRTTPPCAKHIALDLLAICWNRTRYEFSQLRADARFSGDGDDVGLQGILVQLSWRKSAERERG